MWEEECGKDRVRWSFWRNTWGWGGAGWSRAGLGRKGAGAGAGLWWDWGEAPSGLWVGWSHQRQGVAAKMELFAWETHGEWACPASRQRPDCALLSPCHRCPVCENR